MQETSLESSVRVAETLSYGTAQHTLDERLRRLEHVNRRSIPDTILVSMLLPIGDTLLATPALAALRRQFPLAMLSVLVSNSNAGILRDNPNIDTIINVAEGNSESAVLRFARTLSDIRKQDYDLIINLSPLGSIILMMAGRYQRPLEIEMPPLWWLFGGHSASYRSRHAIDHYLQVVAPVLDVDISDEDRRPRIYVTAKDRSSARRLLRKWGLTPANMLVAMHVGGEGFNGRKRWAPARFAAVANGLIDKVGAHVLLLGGTDDVPLCEEVAALIPHGATVIAGQTSLKESAALIEMAALFIGNDSCPLHIAAAVGTSSVGIFGPSNFTQFRPVGNPHHRQRILHSNLPCAPCFNFIGNDVPWVPNTCHSFACLKAISVEEVENAALDLLRDTDAI